MLETIFQAHGPAELVTSHLRDLSQWLAEPRLGDLDKERRILQAEAAARGSNPGSRALGWRYGAEGPGLVAYDDVATGRATPVLLRERAARVFTAGNAVLIMDGPPPADLRLELSPGDLLAVPKAVPCETRYPAMYVDDGGLCVSGEVPRSAAMTLGAELLRQQLEDQFRHQDGHAYSPSSMYERVDADSAVVAGVTDVRPDAYPTLLGRTLALVRRMRAYEPESDKLAALQASQVQAMTDPYSSLGVATRAGIDSLMGRPIVSLDEMVEEVRAVTPSDVVKGFERLHATMLVGVPGATIYAGEVRRLEAPTSRPSVRGRTWRSVNWPGDKSRLRISDDAVELANGQTARSVSGRDVHAMLAYENGLRHVVTRDGYGLLINPHGWRRGASAVTKLDELVPEDRRLPHPSIDGLEQGVKAGFLRRWSEPVARRLRNGGFWILLLVIGSLIAWIGGIALFIYSQTYSIAGLWGILGARWMYGLLFGSSDD